MSWSATLLYLESHWADFCGLLGLGVSIWTLWVATKARDAANAATRAALRRSLAEELQDAVRKNEQVGLFIQERKWDIVWLRANEVASSCSLVVTRWAADLNEESRNTLLTTRNQAGSIARTALTASGEPHVQVNLPPLSVTHARISQALSSELGKSLRITERGE